MPWFQKLCRQSGLLVHQITKPVEKPEAGPKVVLRRTTVVEEVELPAGEASARSAPLEHGGHGGTEARREAQRRE